MATTRQSLCKSNEDLVEHPPQKKNEKFLNFLIVIMLKWQYLDCTRLKYY